MKQQEKITARLRRKKAIKKKLRGTSERPRLSVFRSSRHIYGQIINDVTGQTLVSASTVSPELRSEIGGTGNTESAKKVGMLVAKRALEKGIRQVVFDRNGFVYHGRVKALAESAREGGLEF
jgi:large subunit ribosomal protein L18